MSNELTGFAVAGLSILAATIYFLIKKSSNSTLQKKPTLQTTTNSTSSSSTSSSNTNRTNESGLLIALDADHKLPFKLIAKKSISHDTRLFRFALQSDKHILGLPIGKHIMLSATINDQLVVRPYTPISSDEDIGFFELVVKIYFKNTNERFPDGGKMSQHLESLSIGDTIDVSGPKGRITYLGNGKFSVKENVKATETFRQAKQLGLIAGGTGITPMLQVVRAILTNPEDTTKVSLLFANQTENDILVRDILEKYLEQYPTRFNLWYTLDHAPEDWKYSKGFINADMIQQHLPPAGLDTQILICGPPPMIKFACDPALEKLGFTPDMKLIF